jgi:hypothetical protein
VTSTRLAVATCALILTWGCATTPMTTAREHPDIGAALLEIQRVAVAPPVVKIERIAFSGENVRLTAQEAQIAAEIEAATAAALTRQGFDVVPFDFAGARAADPDFAFALNQVFEAFGRAKTDVQLGRAVSEDRKREFAESLGAAVNQIADRAGVDAVVIAEYYGYDKSGGQVAKDIVAATLLSALIGGAAMSPNEASYMEVGLVDGVTGDLLWADVAGMPKLGAQTIVGALHTLPADVDPSSPADDVAQSPPLGPEASPATDTPPSSAR